MNKWLRLLLILLTSTSTLSVGAQTVTVSKEMTIRNDVAYDVIGLVDDNFVLYRDKGTERVVEVFDKKMKHLLTREITLEKNNADVYAVVPQDSSFCIIYGYREKRKYYMMARSFDKFGNSQDTSALLNGIEEFKLDRFRYEVSEDRSKTLLFTTRRNDLFYTYVIDNAKKKILWDKESKLVGFNVRKDFRAITLSNQGEVNILFEIDNSRFSRKNHHLMLLGLDAGDGYYESVVLDPEQNRIEITI